MNDRTRQLWLPGLAGLAAANIFLMVLTQLSARPHAIVSLSMSVFPGLSLMLAYLPWLVTQPAVGAMGAYLSHRAGGDRGTRFAAALFPSIGMFACWCFAAVTSLLVERNGFVAHHFIYFLVGALCWTVPPGMSLLMGALPLLVAPRFQES